MSLLADFQIKNMSDPELTSEPMITPFSEKLRDQGRISHGVSSYGYDMTLGNEFALYRADTKTPLDPMDVREDDVVRHKIEDGQPFELPAKGFCLAYTVEYVRMPKNVTALVKDKSTYARCGIHVQNTVLEAGWHGQVTLEISNYLDRPVLLWPSQGIVQVLFWSSIDCLTSYLKREGKYQGQTGVTLPKIKRLSTLGVGRA